MVTLFDNISRVLELGDSMSSDQLQALNIAMLGQIITVLQGRRYITKNFLIMETERVVDTTDHDSQVMVDLYQADQYGFYVNNGCNQVLTFRITGGITQAGERAAIGDPLTVPAQSADCVSVAVKELWLPWIGARASFETAPTSGSVNIIMCRREDNWGPSA